MTLRFASDIHTARFWFDLETREPIDLLPDRQSQTVAGWLKAHPGIEIVSRDRAQEYAEGITLGAPQAIQVADRWHLLKNAVDVLKEFLNQHSSHFHEARQAAQSPPDKPGVTAMVPRDRRTEARRLTRKKRLELYHKVQRLKKQGCRQNQVARQLGISKGYAKRLFQAETFPERAPFPPRRTSVDGYTEYLRRRWQEGCQNATQLVGKFQQSGEKSHRVFDNLFYLLSFSVIFYFPFSVNFQLRILGRSNPTESLVFSSEKSYSP